MSKKKKVRIIRLQSMFAIMQAKKKEEIFYPFEREEREKKKKRR
jgi:hypothetical protein